MSPSVVSPAAAIAHIRSTPFPWVLQQFIERGGVVNSALVVNHVDAPHPLYLLREVCFHITPSKALMLELLKAAITLEQQAQQQPSSQSGAQLLLEATATTPASASTLHPAVFHDNAIPMTLFADVIDACPLLAGDVDISNYLVVYLLTQRLYERAVKVIARMEPGDLWIRVWNSALRPLRRGQYRDYAAFEILMSPTRFPKDKYVLDGEAASELLTNGGLVGQLSSVAAAHALDRYLAFVDQEEQRMKAAVPPTAAAKIKLEVHPTPFLVFFGIVAAQRHPSRKYTFFHWNHCWRYFQALNARCPRWFEDRSKPDEAEHLVKFMLSTIARGANPWLTLNVARWAAKNHIVDGVDISIWMLHRLSAAHHPDEAREIAKKLFHWLLNVVGIHAHPEYTRHVIPAARVLVNLGMHSHLAQLHGAMIDHLFDATSDFRTQFVDVFQDLVCPMCNTVLETQNVHVDRCCQNCLFVVPAKPRELLPSFSMTPVRVEQAKKRAKQRGKSAMTVLRGSLSTLSSTSTQKQSAERSYSKPLDAAELLKRKVLTSAAPLVPGLVTSEGASDVASSIDLLLSKEMTPQETRAAMENAVARVDMQKAAREHIQKLRRSAVTGADADATALTVLSLPTKKSIGAAPALEERGASSNGLMSPSLLVAHGMMLSGAAGRGAQHQTADWTCMWCQQRNLLQRHPVECGACGASTGPGAAWRAFKYSKTFNVMDELRGRINNAIDDPTDAVVAAYYLMLFRKTFLLRAGPNEFSMLDRLLRMLVSEGEQVLAGFLYTNVVPPRLRKVDETLRALSALFRSDGGPSVNAAAGGEPRSLTLLTKADLVNDAVFFPAVFGASTCKLCFGKHDWRACPIVTRDFSSSSASASGIRFSTSPQERVKANFAKIKQLIANAVRTAQAQSANPVAGAPPQSDAVFGAYKAFIASPHREEFAAQHADDANTLAVELSRATLFRRAAFVLCHIPFHLRSNEAYYAVAPYFGVTRDDCEPMLSARKIGSTSTQHPNFVQVAMTCCMCLDDRHASFKCDKLELWLENAIHLALPAALRNTVLAAKAAPPASTAATGANTKKAADQDRALPLTATLLRAQVDGWCGSGPERLHAFYRFLMNNVDDIVAVSRGGYKLPSGSGTTSSDVLAADSPVVYAFNRCISQLLFTGKLALATRLLAVAPREALQKATIVSALKNVANASESTLKSFEALTEAAMWRDSDRWSQLIVPTTGACLICFNAGHTFHTCPEVAHLPHVQRLSQTAKSLLSIRITSRGVAAAADFLNHAYLIAHLSTDMMRVNGQLAQIVLEVAARSFVLRMPQRGLRLVRRVPVPMIPLEIYSALWKASGMTEETVTSHSTKLAHLFDRYSLQPPPMFGPGSAASAVSSMEFQPTPDFLRAYSSLVAGSLCRQCCQHGHVVTDCEYFRSEAAFGRDFIAIFRIALVSESFAPQHSKKIVAKMMRFLLTHRYHLPYHVLGVQRAANALCAIAAMQDEPGISLRLLLAIPASQRMRHTFLHLLHAFGVQKAECVRRVQGFLVTGDSTSASGGAPSEAEGDNGIADFRINPDHLLNHRAPIADVAMNLFSDIRGVREALDKADERLLAIIGEPTPAGASGSAILPVQSADIDVIRDAFASIQEEVQRHLGLKLGSQHPIFAEGIEILRPEGAGVADEGADARTQSTVPDLLNTTTTIVGE